MKVAFCFSGHIRYNSMFIITNDNLYDFKNIILEIRNIYGNLLYMEEIIE